MAKVPAAPNKNSEVRSRFAYLMWWHDISLQERFDVDFTRVIHAVNPQRQATVFVSRSEIDSFLADFVETIAKIAETAKNKKLPEKQKSYLLASPILPTATLSEEAEETYVEGIPPSNDTVIMGVIDHGIAFANRRFCEGQKSRVEAVWLQGASADKFFPPPAPNIDIAFTGNPAQAKKTAKSKKPYVSFGRAYNKTQINELLDDHTPDCLTDEEALYREAGVEDFSNLAPFPSSHQANHGTSVADLAAGYDPDANPRPDRPILAVSLPPRLTEDPSGTFLDLLVALGLNWIVRNARKLHPGAGESGKTPIVVCFSYGTYAGPHDGNSPIEKIMQAYTEKYPNLRIVLPAGNSLQERTHAQINLSTKNNSDSIIWHLPPDNQGSAFMEIWGENYSASKPSALNVTLTSPGGKSIVLSETGEFEDLRVPSADPKKYYKNQYARLTQERVLSDEGTRDKITICILPTYDPDPKHLVAASGDWTVKIERPGLTSDETLNLWVQRGDTPTGQKIVTRQSYLIDGKSKRYDDFGRAIELDENDDPETQIKRSGTQSAIANGSGPIVVSGYRASDLSTVSYSSAGRVLPGQPADSFAPTLATQSEWGSAIAGVMASGSKSGSVSILRGTSAAAPQVARWIADQFSGGKRPTNARVCQAAAKEETNRYPPIAGADFSERFGCGRLTAAAMDRAERGETV